MKKLFTTFSFIYIAFFGFSQTGNVGIGTTTPAAKLDITSTDDGVLIPRVALTETSSAAPLTSPTESEMIYNTATTNDVTPGFYYWNGTDTWIRVGTDHDWHKIDAGADEGFPDDIADDVYTNGNVGIGLVDTDDARLNIHSVAGTDPERMLNITLSDDPEAYFRVGNITSSSSVWSPGISGAHGNSFRPGLSFWAYSNEAQDGAPALGINPAMTFTVRKDANSFADVSSNAALANRDAFSFKNHTTTLMDIEADGKVGIGTSSPDASAILDITATDKGVLFPSVQLDERANETPITSPAEGLMVFHRGVTYLEWDGVVNNGVISNGTIPNGFDNDLNTSYHVGDIFGNNPGMHYNQNILKIPAGATIKGMRIVYATTYTGTNPAFRFYPNSGSGGVRVDFPVTASLTPVEGIFEVTDPTDIANFAALTVGQYVKLQVDPDGDDFSTSDPGDVIIYEMEPLFQIGGDLIPASQVFPKGLYIWFDNKWNGMTN